MALREYAGAAKRTALSGDITAASTTISVADATGYPTGATGPFAIALSLGTAAEEKVLITSRSGNTLTVDTRGYDGTTAAAHSSGSNVDHVLTATDIREANAHINATSGAHAATAISFAPAGGVAATTVQAAIEEVVSDANAAYVVRSEVKQATLAAAESTTSASFTDLATVGPAVTVTVGPSGAVLVIVGCHLAHSAAGGEAIMSVALTGAHTSAASVVQAVMHRSDSAGQPMQASRLFSLTGLTPGAVTFTAKYRIDNAAGTATFQARHLAVIPL